MCVDVRTELLISLKHELPKPRRMCLAVVKDYASFAFSISKKHKPYKTPSVYKF